MFSLNFRELWGPVSSWLTDELDQLTAAAQSKWYPQHNDQGGHTAVTADSVAVSGDATVAGDVTVTGTTTSGVFVAAPGSTTAPTYTFTSDTTTGFSSPGGNALVATIEGAHATTLYKGQIDGHRFDLESGAYGTGSVRGNFLKIGRNTSGNGAAGCLVLVERDGTERYLWVEAGKLRIGSPPSEDNSAFSHTGGTVVGTQT